MHCEAIVRGMRINRVGREGSNNHAFSIAGLGKGNRHCDKGAPFTVTNEYICACLASYIGLDVPPFCITKCPFDGKYYFVSMLLDEAPIEGVNPETVVQSNPDVATGIVIFDVYVINGDRKAIDLWQHPDTGRIIIFDHSHALFGYENGVGYAKAMGHDEGIILQGSSGTDIRLKCFEDKLGIFKEDDYAEKCPGHCLVPCLKTDKYFPKWIDRIKGIPDYVIDNVIDEGWRYSDSEDYPLSENERDACKNFLKARKYQLENLLRNNRKKFKSLV